MKNESPDISVVLPSYRSAPLALRSVATLQEFLPRHFPRWEVIVVDDGSGDLAGEADRAGAGGEVRFLSLARNRGKGAAVRTGICAARGAVRLFTDVDLPYELDVLPLAAAYLREHEFHLVIGDRTLRQSSYSLNVGWRRRLASGVFSKVVGTLLTGGFFDTQCGFKAFRGDVAEALFEHARIDRFAFDVELIYLALRARADIKRVPVVLHNNQTSSVRLLRDSGRMLVDVARVRLHAARGGYPSERLAAIVAADLQAVRARREPAAPAGRRLAAARRDDGA